MLLTRVEGALNERRSYAAASASCPAGATSGSSDSTAASSGPASASPAPSSDPTSGSSRPSSAPSRSGSFSIGVNLFLKVGRELARRFAGHPDFDAFIVEQHHVAKVDAPSGTALRLRDQAREGDPAREFPITSIRAGASPGIHTLTYDSAHETVQLGHTARSRTAFAAGALAAAQWLQGRRGIYTFEDMLFGSDR